MERGSLLRHDLDATAGRAGRRWAGVPLAPTLRTGSALGLLACVVACESPVRHPGALADSTWVEVVSRLHMAPRVVEATGSDADRRRAEDSTRAAVLAEYGITPDSLIRFAQTAGADPVRMATLWEAVARRVEALGGPPAERGRRARPAVDSAAQETSRTAPARGAEPSPVGRRRPEAARKQAPTPEPTPTRETRPAVSGPPPEVARDSAKLRERLLRVRQRVAADSS